MIKRIRLPDGRRLDVDMGPASPYTSRLTRRGVMLGSNLADAQPIITPGGIDWRQSSKRKKRTQQHT